MYYGMRETSELYFGDKRNSRSRARQRCGCSFAETWRYTNARSAKTMPTRTPHDAAESTAMTIADCPRVKRRSVGGASPVCFSSTR